VAIKATIFASTICTIVALFTQSFVAKYHLSVAAVQIIGGLILLISALNTLFPRSEGSAMSEQQRSASQLALSSLATPIIVTPAGIAAIMLFILLARQDAGGHQPVAIALAVVMALNFLVMFFNQAIIKVPGLALVLQLFGSVLVVVQGALAVQVLIHGFKGAMANGI
jgi:multiple antibiotic resistance protein